MPKLLIVDDEPNVLYSLQTSLGTDPSGSASKAGPAFQIETAQSGRQALEAARRHRPDAVILDVRLPDMTGLEVFDRLRQTDPHLPVIVITAYAATETAIEAMKRGAFEYLLKPVDLHELRAVVGRALEVSRLRHVPPVLDQGTDEPEVAAAGDAIVGRCAAMQAVYKQIGRVAPRDVTVLITGESGTGKELIARALFHHGARPDKPFLAINCAAIPEALLESELFGHEKGAFTGADRRRVGKFEQCHTGTLFLDEIGDMTAPTQAKVLRVLQEQRFERLGGNQPVETDVRLIAATNKDLEQEVAEGRYRRDLLYRLNVFRIHLPPLRERPDDLPLLVDHFLRCFGRAMGREVRSVAPDARAALQAYSWPGNVRELQSVVKYGLIQAPGDVLTLDSLPPEVTQRQAPPSGPTPSPPTPGTLDIAGLTAALLRSGQPDIYRRVGHEVDRVVLELVLAHAEGNQVQASDLLGISRTTLRAKLRALGLNAEAVARPPA